MNVRRLIFVAALLAASGSAFGARTAVEDWCNTAVNQRNRLPMAVTLRTDSPSLSLDGVWKFEWFENADQRTADFFKVDLDDSSWGRMPVPGMWELNGYGDPLYLSSGFNREDEQFIACLVLLTRNDIEPVKFGK